MHEVAACELLAREYLYLFQRTALIEWARCVEEQVVVDIVVNSNFEGLIITDGKITVKGSARVTTGINNRAELTLDVYKDVAQYFNAFQETSDTNKLDEVEMNQLLNFSEWRKNENVDYN